ncbi:uncharacterized protein LOC143612332 [Bidens hawaiensis]|uniref:uncharacterized protein LOC143612332 n=1 Tax=Bidens hawaiensis TaxID=980011 RepID=UPI0040491A75
MQSSPEPHGQSHAIMEDNDMDSFIFKSVDTNQKQDQGTLSAEDLAWADSCLIQDPEITETNMDSLKEALLQILDQHSEIHDLPNDQTAPENAHSATEEEVTSHAAENSVDQDLEQESYDVLSILKKQPFLPNYHDEMMNFQFPDDSDDDMVFLVSEFVEPLSDEDIFKVWDLDIPVEEDEDELDIDKQLKKALSSDADDTVDSLVESIAELSIK